MYKENGFAYQILILIIIIIIAVAGVVINKVIGKNGVLNQVAKVETQYNKEDILEKLNYKVTQKFIEINNQAKANNQNISELYNSDVVIEYLIQNFIIERSKDSEGNEIENSFDIDISKLEEGEAKIEGNFKLEKKEEKYVVVFYDNDDTAQEIGELQIQQI